MTNTYFNEYNFQNERYWDNATLSSFIDYAIKESPETGFPKYLVCNNNTTYKIREYFNEFFNMHVKRFHVIDTETPSNKQKFKQVKAEFKKLYDRLNIEEKISSQINYLALSKISKNEKEQSKELQERLEDRDKNNAKLSNALEILKRQLINIENKKNDLEKEFLVKLMNEKEKLIESHQKEKERMKVAYSKKLKLRGSEIEEKKEHEIRDMKHTIEKLELQNQLLKLKLAQK